MERAATLWLYCQSTLVLQTWNSEKDSGVKDGIYSPQSVSKAPLALRGQHSNLQANKVCVRTNEAATLCA